MHPRNARPDYRVIIEHDWARIRGLARRRETLLGKGQRDETGLPTAPAVEIN